MNLNVYNVYFVSTALSSETYQIMLNSREHEHNILRLCIRNAKKMDIREDKNGQLSILEQNIGMFMGELDKLNISYMVVNETDPILKTISLKKSTDIYDDENSKY